MQYVLPNPLVYYKWEDNISACDTFAEVDVSEPSDSAKTQAIVLTLNTGMITGTGSHALL